MPISDEDKKLFHIEEDTYPTLDDLTNTEKFLRRYRAGEHRYPFSTHMHHELDGIISRIERCIWFAGFQKMEEKARHRGWEMKLAGGGKFLAYSICGRVMVTLQRGESQFSLVIDQSAQWPRSGVQSASGDLDVIHELVESLMAKWKAGERPVEAKDVSIG